MVVGSGWAATEESVSSLCIVTFPEPYLVNWRSVLFPYEWSIVHPWTLLCSCITFLFKAICMITGYRAGARHT